jgi:hypothetical protein
MTKNSLLDPKKTIFREEVRGLDHLEAHLVPTEIRLLDLSPCKRDRRKLRLIYSADKDRYVDEMALLGTRQASMAQLVQEINLARSGSPASIFKRNSDAYILLVGGVWVKFRWSNLDRAWQFDVSTLANAFRLSCRRHFLGN